MNNKEILDEIFFVKKKREEHYNKHVTDLDVPDFETKVMPKLDKYARSKAEFWDTDDITTEEQYEQMGDELANTPATGFYPGKDMNRVYALMQSDTQIIVKYDARNNFIVVYDRVTRPGVVHTHTIYRVDGPNRYRRLFNKYKNEGTLAKVPRGE